MTVIQFPGPRRSGQTARLHRAMLDWMKHNAGKKVALVSRSTTEIWRDGKLLEIVPREAPVTLHQSCDAVFMDDLMDPIASETIQFPPHEPRGTQPIWETLFWTTPPKDPK